MTTSFMSASRLRTWWSKLTTIRTTGTASSLHTPAPLVVLAPSMRVGGTERQVVELVRGLVDTGLRPKVVLIESTGELLGDLERTGVDVVDLGGGGMRRAPLNALRLHRLLDECGCSTLYAFLSPANFTASLMRLRSRRHQVVWGIRDDRIGAERTGLGRRAARLLTKSLFRLARGMIVNGSSVREALAREGIPEDRIRVVPNSIDQVRFHPDESARHAVRLELGLDESTPVVLSLARLAPKKRHADVLDAFEIVADEVPEAVLLVAGSGQPDYVAGLQRRVDHSRLAGRVRFLGERNDAERLFNAADVTLQMSEAEGFPNSVAESLAAGTPCVATGVGDVTTLVPDDDRVAIGDVKAAAAAVTRRLRRPAGQRVSLLPPIYTRARLATNTVDALRSLGCRLGDDHVRA